MSIISEVLLAIGVIVVSILFVLVAGNIISFQASDVTSISQQKMVEDIENIISTIKGFNGNTSAAYRMRTPAYTLEVRNQSIIRLKTPNEAVSSEFLQGLTVRGGTIVNNETICITKSGDTVWIQQSCR